MFQHSEQVTICDLFLHFTINQTKTIFVALSAGDVRLAAERADRAFVKRRTAIRTPLLQNLAANRAIRSTHRIRHRTVGTVESPSLHLIPVIRRAMRIRTKPLLLRMRHKPPRRRRFFPIRPLREFERNAKLRRKRVDDLVVQLRSVALLEHRQSRLLATDFGGKHTLGKPRLAARFPYLQAEL